MKPMLAIPKITSGAAPAGEIEQAALAGLIGRSQSWLRTVESGCGPSHQRARLNNTVDIETAADVVRVRPDEVTGRPYRSSVQPSHAVDVMGARRFGPRSSRPCSDRSRRLSWNGS
jgi:hypothetical protein